MKKMMKSIGLFAAAMIFCLAFAVTVKVEAAETDIKSEVAVDTEQGEVLAVAPTSIPTFVVSNGSITSKYVGISIVTPSDANYVEVELYNYKNKLVKAEEHISYASFSGLALNKVYTLRARSVAYTYENGQRVRTVGPWSAKKAFILLKCTGKIKSNYSTGRKTCTVKIPKASKSGVKLKKATIYISKKRDGGWKKVKTVKPGKKITITSCKGSKLKTGTTYYLKVVPTFSNKIKSDSYTIITL